MDHYIVVLKDILISRDLANLTAKRTATTARTRLEAVAGCRHDLISGSVAVQKRSFSLLV